MSCPDNVWGHYATRKTEQSSVRLGSVREMGLIAERVDGEGNRFPLFAPEIGTKYPISVFGEASPCSLSPCKLLIYSSLEW